jgi:hypothetical protein
MDLPIAERAVGVEHVVEQSDRSADYKPRENFLQTPRSAGRLSSLAETDDRSMEQLWNAAENSLARLHLAGRTSPKSVTVRRCSGVRRQGSRRVDLACVRRVGGTQ